MKLLFFLVSRVAHIATVRSIASNFPASQNKNLIIIGEFSGIKKALIAARIDVMWSTVITNKSLTAYLRGFDSWQTEIFIYTDFGLQINYYLHTLSNKNIIHIFQDGSASYTPLTRKFSILNYIYSLLMGDGFKYENFVGQSRYTSTLYLYDIDRFREKFGDRSRQIKIKHINPSFLQSISTLADKSYIEEYSYNSTNTADTAVIYLPGWTLKPLLLDYVKKNFEGMIFIKAHPADKNLQINFENITSISSHYVAEQVIAELLSKFNKTIVILESETSSYIFNKTDRVEFYIASILEDKDVQIRKLLLKN